MTDRPEPAVDIGSDRLGSAGDVFYAALLDAHKGLATEESARLNARLLLILANQVGDIAVLKAALAKAAEPFAQKPAGHPDS